MRFHLIACVLAVAVLTGMAAAQNDCYGTDIGDRVCCSTDGEEVFSCPNGWSCEAGNRCAYGDESGSGSSVDSADMKWYDYVFIVLGFIFWASVITCCVRRFCCRRTYTSYVTSQTVYTPINNQAQYQAYAAGTNYGGAAAYGQPAYGQPVMGTVAVYQTAQYV
jgi:hypothetical protein